MGLFGGLLGGATKPIADAASEYGQARERTKQQRSRTLSQTQSPEA